MSLRVRPAEERDAADIRAVLTAAFPTAAEADLVERLMAAGDLAYGFVAVAEDAVIGYAGFSRMVVSADGARVPALALAPLAVLPDHRRRGTGGRLVECGLAAANGRGTAIVFVLGDPGFYGRHGFSAKAAVPFAAAYAGPDMMAQWLSSPRGAAAGEAAWAAAFTRLS